MNSLAKTIFDESWPDIAETLDRSLIDSQSAGKTVGLACAAPCEPTPDKETSCQLRFAIHAI